MRASLTPARLVGCGAVALVSLLPATGSAHHSYAAFDQNKVVAVEGTIREVQYTNPHSWLFLDVLNEQHQPEKWSIEAGGPNILSRQGWKADTLKAGDRVKVELHPMKDQTQKGGSLLAVKMPDGRSIGSWK